MYPHALVDVDQLVDAPTNPTPRDQLSAALLSADAPPRNAVPFGQLLDGDLFAAATPARLCGTLDQLRAEANAANPARDRASDGWIGDAAHAARTSQHNPDRFAVVTAVDLDVDGLDLAAAFERIRLAVVAGRLPGMVGGHLILNRRITTPDFRGWYAYTGPNPHVLHGHAASSTNPARYDDRTPFGCFAPSAPVPAPPPAPVPRPSGALFRASYGQTGPHVARLQTFLRVTFPLYARSLPSTGNYLSQTAGVVREFQRRAGVTGPDANGRTVGPRTAAALARFGFRG